LKTDATAIEDLGKSEDAYEDAKFDLKRCINPKELKEGEKKIKFALNAYNQDM
jgi:hypothetical protein